MLTSRQSSTNSESTASREEVNVVCPELVTVLQTGRPGRPWKILNIDYIKEATSSYHQIKLTELADLMKVHQNTLKLYMKRHNVECQYSALSNADLDILTKRWQEERPESGIRYLVGFLCRHGLQIQRQRVVMSLRQVDNVGPALQQRWVIFRHKYTVK